MRFSFRTIALGLLTAALCVLSAINVRQLYMYRQPTDAMLWQRTTVGLEATARDANTNSPVAVGDRLLAIDDVPVATPEAVARQLARAGIGGHLVYDLWRGGRLLGLDVTVQPTHPPLRRYAFLELVGLSYLAIGLFVLYRRQRAPQALRFYSFCLASFALFCFHFTGKLNLFDHTVFWINEAGLLLAPALLLAYAVRFQGTPPCGDKPAAGGERVSAYFLGLLYLPGILIGLGEIALATGAVWVPATLSAVQDLLDRASYTVFVGYFVAAAASFAWKARHVPGGGLADARKQARCMAWGTALAIAPFAMLYVVPYLLGSNLPRYSSIAVLSLGLVPLAFAYAIWRHHLLEAEVVFRRGVVYTLATAMVVAVYLGLVALAGVLMQSRLPAWGWAGWLLAILVTALLFEPLKQWLQERVDRLFYRERYDYRRTLIEFGRQMNAQPQLEPLLDLVMERLGQTLSLAHAAIFLECGGGEFKLARSLEAAEPTGLDLTFLSRLGGVRRFIEFPHGAARTLELHYFVPCQLRGATVAVFGMGRTRQGEFLTSDDLELVETLAGYFAIALENARLYSTLQQKALQYERLKDFNENIVESIQVGVIAVNLQGTVESWNAQMEALTGRPRTHALGQPVAALLGPEFAREYDQAAAGGNIRNLTKFRMTAGGREKIFNLAIAPLVTAQYQRVGQIVLLSDVTAEVEMEEALSQADRLRSVGLLAAGVAHEVNTPLAVISSYTQMLAKQTAADDPRAAVLATITRQTFRASEIVGNLLNFSRTGSAAFRRVDLNELVKDTLTLVEHPLRSAAVHVITALHPDLVEVKGDPGKLQQVFLNLILNARDAMPAGGTLRLTTGVDYARETPSAWAEVADTGEGIAVEHQSRLFDPFFTTKSGLRPAPAEPGSDTGVASLSTGTGLGLAVTYGIVQEHRGAIRVHSQPGLGAEFRVELPLFAAPVLASAD